MDLYVGTSGYSYPAWKGSFYPEKLPTTRMLRYYAAQLRTVETNGTFKWMPKAAAVEKWTGQVGDDFRFAIKAPEAITHFKRLNGTDELVAELCSAVGVLKERLGPLFFQLPPNFKKDAARLAAFLATLPAGVRAAFEFRHASWFDAEVFGVLRDRGAALCIADADDGPEVPFEATADWGYLRLRRPDYDAAALAAWAERVRGAGWREAYVYFKHEDTGRGPELALAFQDAAGGTPKS